MRGRFIVSTPKKQGHFLKFHLFLLQRMWHFCMKPDQCNKYIGSTVGNYGLVLYQQGISSHNDKYASMRF